ncbi:MAG: SET domain-containing protein [Gammaproteobacteria bacterium]|nr:SET domain-containing protein [Gammaproteobacteria bacterium]
MPARTHPARTHVADSAIHGLGLFASETIPAGQVIGYLRGKPTRRDGTYVLWISETEGFEVACDLRYINHSDRPNACYYDDLSVVALRDICPGEEITHDYGCADW